MILFRWQSLLDNEQLIYANLRCSDQNVRQPKEGVHPIRIDLPGRKSTENDTEGQFYTFIDADATGALEEYFEKVRSWPQPEAPLWVYSNNCPVMKAAFERHGLAYYAESAEYPRQRGLRGAGWVQSSRNAR